MSEPLIDIRIEGTFPSLQRNPIPDVMAKVAERMEESMKLNFLMGGRPDPWVPLKSGRETPLVLTGAMMNRVSSRSTDRTATAGIFDALPQDFAHQFGADIQHPGSDKFQVFEIGGQVVFTHHTEPHQIHIPQRAYVLLQDTDIEFITKLISDAVIQGVTNERIE